MCVSGGGYQRLRLNGGICFRGMGVMKDGLVRGENHTKRHAAGGFFLLKLMLCLLGNMFTLKYSYMERQI